MSQYTNAELTHYGVLGMKWGVRKTPEQRLEARRAKGERKISRVKKKQGKLRSMNAYEQKAIEVAEMNKRANKAGILSKTVEKNQLDRRIAVDDFWTKRGKRKAQDKSFLLNHEIKKLQESDFINDAKIATAISNMDINNVKISKLDKKIIKLGKKYLSE